MVNRAAPPLTAPALRPGEAALTSDLLKTGKPCCSISSRAGARRAGEHPLLLRLKQREGVTIIGIAWKNKPRRRRLAREARRSFTAVARIMTASSRSTGLSGVPETT